MLKKIGSASESVIGLMGLIGILIITANVICRFVLKVSMAWSDEFLRTMFIYGYFLGAALMFLTSGLMRLEILETALSKRGSKALQKALKIFLNIVNVVFFGILTYNIFKDIVWPFIQSGVSTSTSSTPAWVLPAGYGLGVLIIVIGSVRNIAAELLKK